MYYACYLVWSSSDDLVPVPLPAPDHAESGSRESKYVDEKRMSNPLTPFIESRRKFLVEAFRQTRSVSHSFTDYDSWVDESQPVLEKVDVPLLIINSMDDPVIVHENLESFRHIVLENEHLVSELG